LADLRLQPVLRRYGLGGGGGRLSQGPFGILEFLPGAGGALSSLLRPPPLFFFQSLLLALFPQLTFLLPTGLSLSRE
jgi:hypothetical protein